MITFKTYRVRCCEHQILAINVSARTPEDACELARQIRSEIGQHPFEEIDGATENFEAEELEAGDFVTDPSSELAQTVLDLVRGKGGVS
jgi:hypothetical protein